jgi:DNA-binding MurR/RpiR family transcriptional regulator
MTRDLLKIIEEGIPSFSKGQKRIAEYILANYDKAAYLTASRLSGIVGVSESTVVRFAIELGFEGYPEFQHSLKNMIRTKLTSFQRMEVTDQIIGEGDVLDKVLSTDAERIRRTLDGINRESFDQAVERIIHAENIYILGVRSSSYLSGFLNHGFRMIFDNVKFLETTSGSELFEQMIRIKEGDTLIAISFPRYSKRVVKAVEYARARGANVVALTDSEHSPIAAGANQLLVAQSDMASFVDSLVAPLSIINALIVAVSRKRREDVADRLRALEEIWDHYDVYDKKNS